LLFHQYGILPHFQSEIHIKANLIRFQVVPMDIVRLENLSTDLIMIEEFEVSLVMFVYIFLILGAAIALISSLVNSQLFRVIGGVIVLVGLILFLVEIPGILGKMGVPSINFLDLFGSLGLGYYFSMFGVVLIMIAIFLNSNQGKLKADQMDRIVIKSFL